MGAYQANFLQSTEKNDFINTICQQETFGRLTDRNATIASQLFFVVIGTTLWRLDAGGRSRPQHQKRTISLTGTGFS